ncbi:MAG: hypothetical protein ACFE9R_11590 [Candidatus Hermodarchaeota archaeon]
MSNQLTPEQIYSKVNTKEIGKEEAIKLFESLIRNNDSDEIRCKALKFIGKIALEEKITFEIIENCLISDESPKVRFEAAKTLIKFFPNRDNKPLLWAIQNENSIFFFKNLIHLLDTYNNSQLREVREEALKKVQDHYNLNPIDSKVVLDIDYLDYMKFKTEFSGFMGKFTISDESKRKLIKENTELGYRGLGRVKVSKRGYIIKLYLFDLSEIPSSICELPLLKILEISHCKLKKFPENCPNLLSLDELILQNNQFDRLPVWVLEFANKDKYIQKYIASGVKRSDARILALFELLTGHICEKVQERNLINSKRAVRYCLDNSGSIRKILYGSTEHKIGIFPEILCDLESLEELTLKNQDIRIIPNAIRRLKELKVLDLSLNKIKIVPESIKELNNLEYFYLAKE